MAILYTDYGWYSASYSVAVTFESPDRFTGTMLRQYSDVPGGGACKAMFSMVGRRK